MKILVFADSHTDTETMKIVVDSQCPNMVIHLGDQMDDAEKLQRKFKKIPMVLIRGNTDMGSAYPIEKIISVNDKSLFLTHGDLYNVEDNFNEIIFAGKNADADIILFGHTHKPYLKYQDGIWVMNPGRIGRKSSKHIDATYGVVDVNEDFIDCKIINFI